MKTVHQECVDMVCGIADYYSDQKLDREALSAVLAPFLAHIQKDSPGYLNIKAENKRRQEEESLVEKD